MGPTDTPAHRPNKNSINYWADRVASARPSYHITQTRAQWGRQPGSIPSHFLPSNECTILNIFHFSLFRFISFHPNAKSILFLIFFQYSFFLFPSLLSKSKQGLRERFETRITMYGRDRGLRTFQCIDGTAGSSGQQTLD